MDKKKKNDDKKIRSGRPALEEGPIPMPANPALRIEIVRGARRFDTTLQRYTERVLSRLSGKMDQAYLESLNEEEEKRLQRAQSRRRSKNNSAASLPA